MYSGSRVTFDREDGRQQTFRIVGEDEADAKKGSVSYVSPLAGRTRRRPSHGLRHTLAFRDRSRLTRRERAMISRQVYWWHEAPVTSEPHKPVDPACDVAIVGAGYTGLSAAIHARPGRALRPGFRPPEAGRRRIDTERWDCERQLAPEPCHPSAAVRRSRC